MDIHYVPNRGEAHVLSCSPKRPVIQPTTDVQGVNVLSYSELIESKHNLFSPKIGCIL